MYYVYILKLKNNKLYVGRTSDLRRRIAQHKHGEAQYTSKYLPLKLIYYEAYTSKADAIARESFLKTGDGRQVLKKQLKHT